MFGDLAPFESALIVYISGTLLAVILTILITWAIIRSAVLSALRKHAGEERERVRSARDPGHRNL